MATFNKGMQCLVNVLVAILISVQFAAGNQDVDALTALRLSLTDPNDVMITWDSDLVNPCTWFHVTCDGNNQVTSLDLPRANLSGALVPELGNIEYLQHLELFGNQIEGPIPAEIGNLKRLISLDLFNNNLDGSIPSSLGNLTSLKFLRLNNNKLTGSIPQAVVDIPLLQMLDLSTNDLSGPIPGPLGHIAFTNFSNNPQLGGPHV